jgi:predicted regulator of Ras-like GTPase activity (Roadblock/LC7/MglB family)
MQRGFEVSGIPHAVIVSSDGIVRWQGLPKLITPEMLNQLVAANRELLANNAGTSGPMNRWTRPRR